jgi:hypothetical protein
MRRRRVIVALGVVAAFAAVALFLLTRRPEPFPQEVWYCASSGEVRETADGAARRDLRGLLAVRSTRTGAGAQSAEPGGLLLLVHVPSFFERLSDWIAVSSGRPTGFRDSIMLSATGTTVSIADRTWERFEFVPDWLPVPSEAR